eukprot:3369-Heterococcus_DN1.PRE.1
MEWQQHYCYEPLHVELLSAAGICTAVIRGITVSVPTTLNSYSYCHSFNVCKLLSVPYKAQSTPATQCRELLDTASS